jgi:Arc/MetJ family transcription regulator
MRRALELTRLPTKKAVVERALAELVERRAREHLLAAFGKLPPDRDPEELDEIPAWVAPHGRR